MKKFLCIVAAIVVLAAVPLALSAVLTPKEHAVKVASEVSGNAINAVLETVSQGK